MKLLVGIGNPETKYNSARHNVGFITLDRIVKEFGCSFSLDKKINGEVSNCKIGKNKFILLKPHTYVNKSGEAVKKAKAYYKLKNQDIFVLHDDLDIYFPKIKYAFEKSSAGHKGVDSVIHYLKTNKFNRIRVGIRNKKLDTIKKKNIDRDKKTALVGKFVLSDFEATEKRKFNEIAARALEIIESSL
jgi:PTH1 family peptidyl-tRNA hydrolase